MKLVCVSAGTSKSGLCSPMWPVCLSTWKSVSFNAYEAGRQCAVAASETGPRCKKKQSAYQKKKTNMKSHSCSWAVNHAWLFVSLSLQVCRCSLSSPKGNRRGVLAAIARLKTATCSRPWTNTGTRTVSNAPAATAVWGRWAPPFTQKPTSSSVAGTTWGKKNTHLTALLTKHKKPHHFQRRVMSKGQRFLDNAFSEMWKTKTELQNSQDLWSWTRWEAKGRYYLSISFVFAPLDGCCCQHTRGSLTFLLF